MKASWLWWLPGLLSACSSPDARTDLRNILEISDRRDVQIASWEPYLLRRTDALVRASAARSIGHTRDLGLALLVRRCLYLEQDDAVRAEMVFAVGQIADRSAVDELVKMLDDANPDVRAAVVEALGKVGGNSVLNALITRLQDPAGRVRSQALLALARLRGVRAKPTELLEILQETSLVERAGALLADPDPEVRWRAAYTLSEIPLRDRELPLRQGTRSEDAWVRMFSLRGLARSTNVQKAAPDEWARLVADANVHVAASAALALGKIGTVEHLGQLFGAIQRSESGAHHVRASAAGAIADAWQRHRAAIEPSLEAKALTAVGMALADSSRLVRTAALAALAHMDADRAIKKVEEFARSSDSWDRVAAAKACAALEAARAEPLLTTMIADPETTVVVAALESCVSVGKPVPWSRALALQALEHADFRVQCTALTVLREHGLPEDAPLAVATYRRWPGHEHAEGRVEAVKTAAKLDAALAGKELAMSVDDPSTSVAAAAREVLTQLPVPRPSDHEKHEVRSTPRLHSRVDYLSLAPNPRVVLVTERGEIEIEMVREQAPHHVKSFLTLARKGAYDGLSMHRVVSGFVVQGLDPRGDGWGTGGVFLRDEINPLPYIAGAVGMPNSGPDSGGCQIFITHVPTPHLDGSFTVFGRVVRGMDTVDAIDLGDRCTKVQVVDL